ncbi:MAG: nicotinate phosphoribosyltransferase [Elusimicrobiaceae bacterium]
MANNPPVIQSWLDTDFYKFTMGQLVFHRHNDVPVKYSLINRKRNIPLADYIDEQELRRELDSLRRLAPDSSELSYLRRLEIGGRKIFSEDYLSFLGTVRLPDYELKIAGRELIFSVSGIWSSAIYWEVFALSIINELYCRAKEAAMTPRERREIESSGVKNLTDKIDFLKRNPGIRIIDFGTRRRFGRQWHGYVVKTLKQELSPQQFLGTSNVRLAMDYGIAPIGTLAHEMYMAMAGIRWDNVRASHNEVLKEWWNEYGAALSIALTDNYGSDFFFSDMTGEQARQWKGLRHDSGLPLEFAEKAIAFYKKHGIDPKEKVLVFSDSLTLPSIAEIYEKLKNRTNVAFGWGTNLTNDRGIEPLSIVIKLTESCGHGIVKLSDDTGKSTGTQRDIEHFRNMFSASMA